MSCVTGRSNWTENAHYRKIFIAFYLFKATTLFWQLELPSLDPVSGCEGGSGFWQAIRTQVELACGPQEPPGLWTPTASWPGLNGDLANPPGIHQGKKKSRFELEEINPESRKGEAAHNNSPLSLYWAPQFTKYMHYFICFPLQQILWIIYILLASFYWFGNLGL